VKPTKIPINTKGMHIHRRLFMLAKDVHGFFPGMALLSLLTTVVVITQMYLLSRIIAEVFIHGPFTQSFQLFLLAGSIALRSLLLYVRERYAQRSAVQIKSAFRRKLFDHLLALGPAFTRRGKTGELVASVTDGVEKLDDYFTRYIPSLIHIMVLPTAIIIFTLMFDWISGLIMLLTGPLIVFFMWLIGTYAKKLTQEQWQSMSRLSSHFLDALQGLKTLKMFGMNRREATLVDQSSDRFRTLTMKVLQVAFLSGMVLELAASISIAMVALQVGIRLIEGMMQFQPGLFVLLLAPEFYLPFRTLGSHHHAGMEGAAAAARAFEILDQDVIQQTGKDSFQGTNHIPRIECSGLTYTYPGNTSPALKAVNCVLEPGTMTAVVGHTGAGKTTFAHLLLGFLKPGSGSIQADGIPVDALLPEHWRSLLAYVPQHPHFFNGTILENLLMARPHADLEQVMHAAREAGAHEFIEAMPLGYNTPITDNASRLSGGEKQRLAIARAFLKDAPLLILDEPTSSLDPESEQLIAGATARIVKNRSTLIIAHRLQTVRQAANILVFQHGSIAESGTHEALMQHHGIYAGYLQTLGITKQQDS
jgi:ATP-binding cassette, subfamily C, bacterial CydD